MSWDRSGGSGRSEFNFKYFPSRFILLSRKLTKSPLALPSRSPMPTPEPPHALCVTGVPNKAQKGGCFQRLPCSCSRAVSAGRLVQTGLKAGLSVRSHAGILLCNEQNRLLFFTANPVEATQLPGEAGDREDPGAPHPPGSADAPGPGMCHSHRGARGPDSFAGQCGVHQALLHRGLARDRGNGGTGGSNPKLGVWLAPPGSGGELRADGSTPEAAGKSSLPTSQRLSDPRRANLAAVLLQLGKFSFSSDFPLVLQARSSDLLPTLLSHSFRLSATSPPGLGPGTRNQKAQSPLWR